MTAWIVLKRIEQPISFCFLPVSSTLLFPFRNGSVVVDSEVVLDTTSSDSHVASPPDANSVACAMTTYFTNNSDVAAALNLDVASIAVIEDINCKCRVRVWNLKSRKRSKYSPLTYI